MPTDQPTPPKVNRRWFLPTPGKLLAVLLAIEAILLFSERWIPKGWAVLIAVAAVGLFLIVMVLWFVIALLFHRRFQFSIRSLLVLTIVVAILSSRLAVEMKRATKQVEAVEAIRKAGGQVDYFYETRNAAGKFVGEELPRPVWLQALLGKSRVFQVYFNDTTAKITDADLEPIEELTDLKCLFLQKTLVTNEALRHIEGLTELEFLFLDSTPITDLGLKYIHDLPRLQFITLGNTKVTGSGFQYMKGLCNLEELSLDKSLVTDAALPYLEAMPQLRLLDLTDTKVTDNGLLHLGLLTKLKIIRLNRTNITDDGLKHFEGALQLEKLELNGTKVTEEGIKKLQQVLPSLQD